MNNKKDIHILHFVLELTTYIHTEKKTAGRYHFQGQMQFDFEIYDS